MDKIAKYRESIYKEAKKKDPNRTKLWNDRIWSTTKEQVVGGLPGAGLGVAIGGAAGGARGAKVGGAVGGAIGNAGARTLRLKNQSTKTGVKLDKEDYVKAVGSAVTPSFPGMGVLQYTNTPEAIIKHKKREALNKQAKEKERVEFSRDRLIPGVIAGAGGALLASPLTKKMRAQGVRDGVVGFGRSLDRGSNALGASYDLVRQGAPMLLGAAAVAGTAKAGINAARLTAKHKEEFGTNPELKDYLKTGLGGATLPLLATPEAVIIKKKNKKAKEAKGIDKAAMYKEAIYKEAASKSEWKPFIPRKDEEFQRAGGMSETDVKEQYSKPAMKKMLSSYAGGIGAGALAGLAAGARKGHSTGSTALLGAGLGSIGGALVGTARNIPGDIKMSKSDNAAIRAMIKNRLGEGATEADIKKAVLKNNLTGIMPKQQ